MGLCYHEENMHCRSVTNCAVTPTKVQRQDIDQAGGSGDTEAIEKVNFKELVDTTKVPLGHMLL